VDFKDDFYMPKTAPVIFSKPVLLGISGNEFEGLQLTIKETQAA
jgi:hypothetical protein